MDEEVMGEAGGAVAEVTGEGAVKRAEAASSAAARAAAAAEWAQPGVPRPRHSASGVEGGVEGGSASVGSSAASSADGSSADRSSTDGAGTDGAGTDGSSADGSRTDGSTTGGAGSVGPAGSAGQRESGGEKPGVKEPDPAGVRLAAAWAALAGCAHPVVEGLGKAWAGLDGVSAGLEREWALTPEQAQAALVVTHHLANRAHGLRLSMVRGSLAVDPKGTRHATRTVLLDRCAIGRGRAGVEAKNAELTDPDDGVLPGFGRAFVAGHLSDEHMAIARRLIAKLPTEVVAEHREFLDKELTGHAVKWSPEAFAVLAAHLLDLLCPARGELDPDHAFTQRALSWVVDAYGMTQLRGQLPPEIAAEVTAVLESLLTLDTARGQAVDADGDPAEKVLDGRSGSQRRADALRTMAALAGEGLAVVVDPDSGLPRQDGPGGAVNQKPSRAAPRVVVSLREHPDGHDSDCTCSCTHDHTSTDPPADAESARDEPGRRWYAHDQEQRPVSWARLQRLLCDAVLDVVRHARNGRVLSMNTLGRIATPAQLTALVARDGGCAFPGCTMPPRLCQAHHLQHWADGGPTTLDNLTLLCRRHHHAVHEHDGWQALMIHGQPHFIPPRWSHPNDQRPRRNTLRQAIDRLRAETAAHLRLKLDPEVDADDTDHPLRT